MVGTTVTPDAAMAPALRSRLGSETHRFLVVNDRGLGVRMTSLAELVAEIVTEYTEHITAERDALAEDLAWELNATSATSVAAGGVA